MTKEERLEVAKALETYRMTKDAPITPGEPSAWETLEASLDALANPDIEAILDECDEADTDPREEPGNECFEQAYRKLVDLVNYDPETDNLEDL